MKVPLDLAKKGYRFARNRLWYGTVLLPYGRAKHRKLLKSSERLNNHTYTCFYRSPAQLDALTGPVLTRLASALGDGELSVLVFAGSNGSEAYTLASELRYRRPQLKFKIRASDLHEETVQKAKLAEYTLQEITQGLPVPETFLERTFERHGEVYRVRPEIRQRVTFEVADLFDEGLSKRFTPAHIVFAQNVFFHMPPDMAQAAFERVLAFVKPGGAFFCDGMELDMREALTVKRRLEPLDYRHQEIYEHSRLHIPPKWWEYYWGNEPYVPWAKQRLRRYGTVFWVPTRGSAE